MSNERGGPEWVHGYAAMLADGAMQQRDDRDDGYWCEGEPYYQLQMIDERGKFESDADAILQCIRDAKQGDEYAIEQLRLAQTDGLVRQIQYRSERDQQCSQT